MKARDDRKRNRILYIIEAALEYFVSIAVSGAYLACLTTAIGMSDALTGVLTSFVSLGCGFQILAVLFRGNVRRNVTILHLINETAFTLLYVTPFFHVSTTAKTVIFTVLMLVGFALNNVANPSKTDWFMQSVDKDKRGVFTATKEIVSLISGMLFSLLLGYVIDGFKAAGNETGAFVLCGAFLGIITAAHALTIIFSKPVSAPVTAETAKAEGEVNADSAVANADTAPATDDSGAADEISAAACEVPDKNLSDINSGNSDKKEKASGRGAFRRALGDKNLVKVVITIVLWRMVQYSTVPFYGTYQIKELGFSMVFVSALAIVYALVRAVFERPIGRLADKKGFAASLNVCYLAELAALAVAVFMRPENGAITYSVYYVLFAICSAGISSGELNLIYDYVGENERVAALAIKATAGGLAGFLTTLALSPLVALIQARGLTIFGVNIYAQQVTSLIGLVLCVILIVYNTVVVKKIKR